MEPGHRASLRTLTFIVLASCFSIPILVLGLSRARTTSEEIRERIDGGNLLMTRRAVADIESLVTTRKESVQVIAQTLAEVETWDPLTLQSIALQSRATISGVEYLLIADASGTSLVFAPSKRAGDLAGVDYNDRVYIQRLRRTRRPVVSEVIVGKSSGVPQIAIAAPILSRSGALRGFVTATVPLTGLLQQVSTNTDESAQQRLVVLDSLHRVLIDTGQREPSSPLNEMPGRVFELMDATTVLTTTDDRNESVRARFGQASLEGQTWGVWSLVPEALIQQRVDAELRSIYTFTGTAIGFSFLLSLLLSGALARRLASFQAFAGEVGRGNLGVRLPPVSSLAPREFALLQTISNSTLDLLEASQARQNVLLQTLEAKTEEMRPLAAAWQHVGDAIEFLDLDGVVQFSNPAALALRAHAPEAAARESSLFREVEDASQVWASLRRGEIWRGNLQRAASSSHDIREDDVTVFPILDDEGDLSGAIVIRRDVTHMRREEQRANRNERLAALGTMAATVAHEINNPLTYVQANVEDVRGQLELAGLAPGDDSLDALDDALEGVDRVASIVRRMLTLARPPKASKAICDVESAITSAIEVSQNAITHRGELITELRDPGWANIRDSSLFQVMVNLLNNAVQALPTGAPEGHHVRVHAQREGERVIITVQDTGVGMESAQLERIFDPFYTTKKIGDGTGLGLSICKSMIEKAGGSITATSTLGVGSSIVVELPACAPPAPTAVDPAATQHEGLTAPATVDATASSKRQRVLIVDDEPTVAGAIARMLRAHTTEVMSDPREALERLQAAHFDVVVSDVMMPGLNGYELYTAATRVAHSSKPRWIFVTGGIFGGQLQEQISGTGWPRVQKPIAAEQLRRLVEHPEDNSMPSPGPPDGAPADEG